MIPVDPRILNWISAQRNNLLQRVVAWSRINTGTGNVVGIEKQIDVIAKYARALGGNIRRREIATWRQLDSRGNWIEKSLGPALVISKHPNAARKIFLCIHCDTVYPPENPCQSPSVPKAGKLIGPGVADAKGGIVVMLASLEALEQSEHAGKVGWEVFINPDEEIGSPGSSDYFVSAARRFDFGLLFEPALPGGELVDRRKGSSTFSLEIRGKSAHAGRDFHAGKSAMLAAAHAVIALHQLNSKNITVNTGAIDGGGAANVVPDLAIVRFNARMHDPSDQKRLKSSLGKIVKDMNKREGIVARLHQSSFAAPKILDPKSQTLMKIALESAVDLGLKISTHPSGGATDGSRLASLGLPNIDSLGPVGGHLHSPDEYLEIDSLVERTQLTYSILTRLVKRQT